MTTLLLLPGDGIGPEVIDQVRRVAARLANDLTLDERDFGGCSFDKHGTPLTEEAEAAALKADAVLMGAVGGPQGRTRRATSGPSPACFAYAKPWASTPTCVRPCVSTP